MSGQPAAQLGHWGLWRAVAALPAIVCSSVVALGLAGGFGQWTVAVWLGWLACSAFMLSRAGERCVVQLGWGFRCLRAADRALVEPVWTEVLERCRVPRSAVDLYLQRGAAFNAYAVGGHSVAVTTRLLDAYRAGVVDRAGVAAVLSHELGHHQTHGARYIPLIVWLTLPWRAVCRALLYVGHRIVGSQPPIPLAGVALTAVLVACVQLARSGRWGAVALLAILLIAAAVTPLMDAAISRAAEFAADRFAASVGYAVDLVNLLRCIDTEGESRTIGSRLLARHPSVRDRVSRLSRDTDLSGASSAVSSPSSVH